MSEKLNINFIKQELERRGWSYTMFASQMSFNRDAEVQKQHVFKWLSGECLPGLSNTAAMAKVLECSIEDLLLSQEEELANEPRT